METKVTKVKQSHQNDRIESICRKLKIITPTFWGLDSPPPLEIISEMILGWSGTPTPWNHFSNIDFPYPEIILAVTTPPKKSFPKVGVIKNL